MPHSIRNSSGRSSKPLQWTTWPGGSPIVWRRLPGVGRAAVPNPRQQLTSGPSTGRSLQAEIGVWLLHSRSAERLSVSICRKTTREGECWLIAANRSPQRPNVRATTIQAKVGGHVPPAFHQNKSCYGIDEFVASATIEE